MNQEITKELLSFLAASPTSYHAVDTVSQELLGKGFEQLSEGMPWNLEAGKSYFVTRNRSSLIAFKIPKEKYVGFQMVMSHADSPAFKLKEIAEQKSGEKYLQLDTERYGGPIYSTWLDRPLKIAGRVLVQMGDQIETRLVQLDDAVLIPSLAIHMNRDANNGYTFNPQTDLLPLCGDGNAKGFLLQSISRKLRVSEEQILGKDLYVICDTPAMIWGPHEEYYSSSRIDNLGCAFTTLKGFEAGHSESVSVYALFDNEETGSATKQGAASTFLSDVLRRIHVGMGRTEDEFYACMAASFLVSADNAHAVHPNHPEKADPFNRPYMNEGIVVKQTASSSYATDGASAAVFRTICKRAGVPVQSFANRSDMPGGSTMGCCITGQVAVNTVDIGLPQLVMHSCYETAGTQDAEWMVKAITEFYNTTIQMKADGTFQLR
ncbi:MAG: M18 family aminopeptidase [Candidatus Merdivicinus sp.]|jgi:aspartyl aminopeptidase